MITVSKVLDLKHDPAGWRNVPATFKPVDRKKIQELLSKEWELFEKTYPESGKHNKRAAKTLPLGVTSSFQHWDPFPITIVKGRGAYVTDVDGRKLLDLSMGFGAMLVGHLNPKVVRAVRKALRQTGTLFVTPATLSTEAAERFRQESRREDCRGWICQVFSSNVWCRAMNGFEHGRVGTGWV